PLSVASDRLRLWNTDWNIALFGISRFGARLREGLENLPFGDDVAQQDHLARAVSREDGEQGNATTLERIEGRLDLGIAISPGGFDGGDVILFDYRLHGGHVERPLEIPLTGKAPVGGEVEQHRLSVGWRVSDRLGGKGPPRQRILRREGRSEGDVTDSRRLPRPRKPSGDTATERHGERLAPPEPTGKPNGDAE